MDSRKLVDPNQEGIQIVQIPQDDFVEDWDLNDYYFAKCSNCGGFDFNIVKHRQNAKLYLICVSTEDCHGVVMVTEKL